MPTTPTPLMSQPGIRRDGTRLQSQHYTDGEWVRFEDGTPCKMGGFRALTKSLGGISRGLHAASVAGVNWVHSGASDRLEVLKVKANDQGAFELSARTPVDFAPHVDHLWSFDNIYDVIDGEWKLVAHAAPNGLNIDNETSGVVYIGQLNDEAVLIPIDDGPSDLAVTGGICCIHPFLFAFGSNGQIIWSVSNKPSDVTSTSATGTNIPAGEARPTGKKIIAGRSIRGMGVPGGLFWSLDTLLRASFVGGAATWDFDDLSSIEIIASKSVVEYNGAYFWIGAERFQSFTGAVRDVPNAFNRKWFFKNLNWTHAAKIYGFAIPSKGEIWWCFPKGESTECNHAVILHVNSGAWYDTPLPNGGRSAGLSPSSTYPYPIMAGVRVDSTQYRLWQHEIGVDEVDDTAGTIMAVRSSYTTGDISMLKSEKPSNASIEVAAIEPDFVQSGNIILTVLGNENARDGTAQAPVITIEPPGDGLPPAQQVIELKEEFRQLRFKFESNEVSGNYEAGLTFAHIQPSGERRTS